MLGAGALGRPRGMVWRGRRGEGSGWGTRVYLWWIHLPPFCHLQPLPSSHPLSPGPWRERAPGLVFGECGECSITRATSAARRGDRKGRSCKVEGAVPGPNLEVCPTPILPISPAPPAPSPWPGMALEQSPLSSWPHWLPRAMSSTISLCIYCWPCWVSGAVWAFL